MLTTPILFVVFNRPHTTAKVFEAIKQAKPAKLFIASDGPRANHPTDKENCEEVRRIVANIDWDCKVETLYQPANLGCRRAVSTAISWFFNNVEEGIILEDDTLPTPGFFDFCSAMLDHYRDNEQIMMISGDNFQWGKWRGEASYYISGYAHIWGWASWRRAWQHYDVNMNGYSRAKAKNMLQQRLKSQIEQAYWLDRFERAYNGEINTWDYQWVYTIWQKDGLTVIPNKNLVTNIGFGAAATNTSTESNLANIPTGTIEKISHPNKLERNEEADHYSFKRIIGKKMLLKTYIRMLKGLLK